MSKEAVVENAGLLEAIQAGDQAARVGDLTSARSHYESALSFSPSSLDAKTGLEYVAFMESGRKGRYQRVSKSSENSEEKLAKKANRALLQKEFEAKSTRPRSLPSAVFLEHTTRCNFHCPHCTKGYDPYLGADMVEGLADLALDSLLPTLTWACITGFGEPTIGDSYGHIIKRLLESDVTIHFSTNASTLTIPHIIQLVEGNAKIILSIDGATKETFETIRAGGKWEQIQHNLHALKRVRSILGGESIFGITFVVMRMNVHELPTMVRMIHDLNLDFLKVHDYQPIGKEFDNQAMSREPEKANVFFDEAEALAKELGVDLILPPRYSIGSAGKKASTLGQGRRLFGRLRLFPKRRRFPQRCILPWKFTQIRLGGEVTPCCQSTRLMGMLEETPFSEIWNNRRYRFFRWRIDTFFPPPECRECHVYEGINKGNATNTMSEEGLLLRLAYSVEKRVSEWLEKRKQPEKPQPEPTYYQGKKWKGKVNEEGTP